VRHHTGHRRRRRAGCANFSNLRACCTVSSVEAHDTLTGTREERSNRRVADSGCLFWRSDGTSTRETETHIMPLSTSFESAWLYGAREAFATARGFLLDERPRVLALSSLQAPEVPGLVSIGPPEALPLRPNQPDQKRSPEPARAFNPSIALAPHGLCPRCKYAMTLRVDTLHQCDSESSPYNGGPARLANGNWFQGTVVGILDAELRLLGWTWLLNAPAYQIASADQNASTARRAGCLLAGASDGFRMSWAKQTFDARLLHWKVSAADERRWALRMAMGSVRIVNVNWMAMGSVRMARLLRSVLSDGLLCSSRRLTKPIHSDLTKPIHGD